MSKKGKVKFYNEEKKFGFIKQDKGDDIYFNSKSFKGKPPVADDIVEFDIKKDWYTGRTYATNICVIEHVEQKSYSLGQKLYIPSDCLKILGNLKDVDNFSLKLNKLPKLDHSSDKDKFIIFKKDKKEITYKIEHNFSNENLKLIFKEFSSKIRKMPLDFKEFVASPEWRMVLGLGSPSVYETSMTLHHIYGFPYIPGQAVKGVVRSYIINEDFNGNEETALKNEVFKKVFGSQKNKGDVMFFDAYPVTSPKLKIDVINVHYKEYYESKKPPADYLNPNPIYFLTVEKTKFKFLIGSKKNKLAHYTINNKTIFEWVKEALTNSGVGAKTSVGYGLLKLESN